MSIQTPESLKDKATIIRKFLKERCDVDVSHGHSLELISRIFSFKDWNTASAALKPKIEQNLSSAQIATVGDMKRALETFDDSVMIDACYKFKHKDFEIDPLADPEDEINQEFSLTMEEFDGDIASFTLKLEHESITQSCG
jgi:glyoxalase superfamily protein